MEILKINKNDNKFAIFLNHHELIKCIYKENILADQQTISYALKAQLFHYYCQQTTAKRYENATDETSDDGRNRKRKRKDAKQKYKTKLKDFAEIKEKCDCFLAQLKDAKCGQQNDANDKMVVVSNDFPRYWEEIHEFPQFHGANEFRVFKDFQLKQRKYLIPPQCRFYNYDVTKLHESFMPQLSSKFDFIVLDPPWRNKYIRRLKKVRQELSYKMLYDEDLKLLPIAELIHTKSLIAIWCTNSLQHQTALIDEILPKWNLTLVHSIKWFKLKSNLKLIGELNENADGKQPYEMLYLAATKEAQDYYKESLEHMEMLFSVASIIHSHKPPILPCLEKYLPSKNPKCLEIFARYLQPNWTSIGLEVLKLMDHRLYDPLEGKAEEVT